MTQCTHDSLSQGIMPIVSLNSFMEEESGGIYFAKVINTDIIDHIMTPLNPRHCQHCKYLLRGISYSS